MKKPRIVIFSTSYFPHWGGAEVAIREITERLSGQYDFELITSKLGPGLKAKEVMGAVTVHRLGIGVSIDKLLVPILGTFKLASIVLFRGVDIFWPVQASFASAPAYMYNILFFWAKRPVVLTLQEGESEEHMGTKKYGMLASIWKLPMLPLLLFSKNYKSLPKGERGLINTSWVLSLSRTDVLTVISQYLKGRAERLGYVGRVVVIPNGIDYESFSERETVAERAALRESLSLRKGDKVVVTTSRLVHKNAIDVVITAMKFLPEDVKFLLAGSGPLGRELKDQVKVAGLKERVRFLGSVSHGEGDIAKLLHVSDVFTRPSRSEGFGISFLEAMAAGVPVVATGVGGIVDFLRHEDTGLVCKLDDPQDLAFQISRLLEDKKLHDVVVRNARELARRKYDWNGIAVDMHNEAFKKVLG